MNKNTIIGFVLIGFIIFGFSWYQSREYQKQREYQAVQDSIAAAHHLEQWMLDSAERAASPVPAEQSITPVVPTTATTDNIVRYKDTLLTAASQLADTTYTLFNELFEVEFTTKGAQPYSAKLYNYRNYDSTDLYIFKPGQSNLGYEIYTGELINTSDFTFELAELTDSTIVMRLPFSNGAYIQQKYWLTPNSYMVKNEMSFVGMNDIIPRNITSMNVNWDITIPSMEKGRKNEQNYSKLSYCNASDLEVEEVTRARNGSENVTTKVKWFAFQQQFFSAIMTAGNDFTMADLSVEFFGEDTPDLMNGKALAKLDINPTSTDFSHRFDFYFGPNSYQELKQYDLEYEKIIPLGGWLIGWVSRWIIIPTFNFLGRFISNYGIIILLLTLIIKIVLSPLTIKSYLSSAKMAVLKPEINKLNEKYPKQEDAMKKQQAMMDLYKRAGVSPMGGCLPMLLQFPILFAMFRFFPASIELRQESFLWASDLSAYDSILDLPFKIPLYGDHVSLFALLMAISMFLYSKMNASQMSDDPNMASMKFMTLYMMPIMMLFIGNNLSSGLSYYYLLSNIITMLQTWIIRKFFVKEEKILAKLKDSANKPVKKSKWQLRLEEAQRMQEQMAKQKNRRR